MPALVEHCVVLFGGQGSSSIFSPSAAATAEEDSRSSSAGSILLSRCHAAFLQEIASLDARLQHLLAIHPAQFSSPRDLLKPVAQYHNHAVLQATTIYLCQLLHYLAETQRIGEPFEDSFDRIQETAGFSSGLVPAAVVSCSRRLDDFVTSGVEGFRLTFWIACRSILWSLSINESDSIGDSVDSEATLSLVIRGLSPSQVEERLSQHFEMRGTSPLSQQRPRRLHVSAISNSSVVSVSGPRADLSTFRVHAVPDHATTFAQVHGWYHGGEQLEGVVLEVLHDLRRGAVSFPTCSTSIKPIRSTIDGRLFDSSSANAPELLEWLVRHLLIHCVNWSDTAHQIAASVRELLEREPATVVKLLSFGPGSGSLFPELQPLDPRVKLLDFSPFKASRKSQFSCDHQDSIAIVGLSVHLPRGKGTEELWETLSKGLNAVQEIPESRFKVFDYYSEGDSHKPRRMPTKHGAFLNDPFS